MTRNDQPGRRDDKARPGGKGDERLDSEQTRARAGQMTEEEIEEQQQGRARPTGMQDKKGNQPR